MDGIELYGHRILRDRHRIYAREYAGSDLAIILLPEGRHFVQIDEPEQVARYILELPLAKTELAPMAKTAAPRQNRGQVRYRIMHLVFGIMNILLAPFFLFDRWLIYRRLQKIFRADSHQAITAKPSDQRRLVSNKGE